MKISKNKLILIISLIILVVLIITGFFLHKKGIIRFGHNINNSQIEATSTVSDIVIKEDNDFYTINVVYPNDSRDKESKIKNTVEYWINQDKEAWKVGGDLYNQEKALETKYPDRPKMKYELDISYSSSSSSKLNTISYQLDKYEFTGGAHGDDTMTTFTFDNNGIIDIQDILNLGADENDRILSNLLAQKLTKVLGEYADNDMIQDGLGLSYIKSDGTFDNKKCNCDGFNFASNFKNFVVTDDGIKIIMDKYSVAAGAVGNPEVILYWQEVMNYLTPNFLTKIQNVFFNNASISKTSTANPASENCLKQGGTLKMQMNPAGEYGVCYFEDNRQCEEWALMRGDCPAGGRKITGYDNDQQAFCAISGGTVDMNKNTCTLKGKTCDIDSFYKGDCK